MHGTCDMEKLGIWMNLIGAIMKYAKETPFDKIVEIIKTMNDVSTYKQFFEEVLRGSLEYNDAYRALLREGIVNAKHSYLNWEANKDKPKKKKSLLEQYTEEMQIGGWDPEPEPVRVRPIPRQFVNAQNPADPIAGNAAVGRFENVWRAAAEVPEPQAAADQLRAARERMIADMARRDAERREAAAQVRRPARPAPVRR